MVTGNNEQSNEKIEKLLAVTKIEGHGTGQTISQDVHKVLVEWKLDDRIVGAVFDTTSSNTGAIRRSVVSLMEKLGRPLLPLACRHHAPSELILKKVFSHIFDEAAKGKKSVTVSPGVAMFSKLRYGAYLTLNL